MCTVRLQPCSRVGNGHRHQPPRDARDPRSRQRVAAQRVRAAIVMTRVPPEVLAVTVIAVSVRAARVTNAIDARRCAAS